MAVTINSQQVLGAILAMESGCDLSSLACKTSEEPERDEVPSERFFLEIYLWLSYLVSEFEISSFYRIYIYIYIR